jgi:excinuclease ABC subunit A
MDLIRELFAETPEAKARGYTKGRFSFNVAGGRCEACEGAGVKTIEMQFLPDVDVPCEVCEGRRFNQETLEVTWKGWSVAQVLEAPIERALEHFRAVPRLQRILQTLVDVGLGYVALGQPSDSLSGGEAQRVKLATELHRPATGRTLYLLDEPTTGLHAADILHLLACLQRLVDQGNTVLVVEHHPDVIFSADHLIDLGPEGGEAGGHVLAVGPPEVIAGLDSPTGRSLAALRQGLMSLSAPRMAANVPPLAADVPPVPYSAGTADRLEIRGARMHNLRNVDVDILHGQMTVITGPSGSGKTSLAFDTIFSEGQRRYVESLSTYARRFLGRVERAPVDRVDGLKPAIAIDQKSASHNPRSTVATVTEIHDVLRLLWARVGQSFCPACDRRLEGRDPSRAAAWMAEQTSESGWLVASLRPAEWADDRRQGLIRDGWTRLLDSEAAEVELTDTRAIAMLEHGTWLVLDRLAPARASRARLAEAVRSGYALGGGSVTFVSRGSATRLTVTELPNCPDHGAPMAEALTPRHFSFNARLGACPACEGLGHIRRIVKDRLFPAVKDGFWEGMDGRVSAHLKRTARMVATIEAAARAAGIDLRASAKSWTESQSRAVMDGLPQELAVKWTDTWGSTTRTVSEERTWPGLRAVLAGWNTSLEWLVDAETCPACHGGRLRSALLAVKIGGLGIHHFSGLTVEKARQVSSTWSFSGEAAAVAERPLGELQRRLQFLLDVGLGYLSLDRPAETLSGGESQRIRLASQLGSQLTGVIYVLDEPTVGLHPRDTARLIRTLEDLRDLGNTVVVVEHDPDMIRRADQVIDLGPGAGKHGGTVLASGTPGSIQQNPASLTGRWLCGAAQIPPRPQVRKPRSYLKVGGVEVHNLRGVEVSVPTGVWTAVTGVSGSGKSTLIMDTLAPALARHLGNESSVPPCQVSEVGERVDRLVLVDQQPIGRTPRSTPATFTGVFDALRKLFAETNGAKERGWKAGRFSFNTEGGRCTACEGRGAVLVEMHFLPDVWVTCESCRGKRFNRDTLAVRWKGHSIADILAMRADEALELFSSQRAIAGRLRALVNVGLGYLELGQPGTTLSGGEAQRVKLAAELVSRAGHTVYILDEPTTGLHLSDVSCLVGVLHSLVDQGHTVITIEHHLDMIRQADHVIDLGPEGGSGGGRIVGEGTPSYVATLPTPTGLALAGATAVR